MIILDTNVCSELLKPTPNHVVVAWIRSLKEIPRLTVISRAELLSGVALLPDGERKDRLNRGIKRVLAPLGDCLPVNSIAADYYATIIAKRHRVGRPISGFDALIAAIVKVHNATLATRNVKDFQDLDLEIINPWETRQN